MWDVKAMARDLIETRDIQIFVNRRFKSDAAIVLPLDTFKYVGTDDAFFNVDKKFLCCEIEQVEADYCYDDLRQSDVVLDIGACLGGFALKVAGNVRRVYAVEPIMVSELKANIDLNRRFNRAFNVYQIDVALGDGEQRVEWGIRSKMIKCKRLSEIIRLCGGRVDFIKCDCEGGEWSITADELAGVRRLECEVHNFDHNRDENVFLGMLTEAGFTYRLTELNRELMIVHAFRRSQEC